ncbi:MAG: mannitol dehydrogenase-like protein [Frankiales bacterium]|nr:mannitol dehydrogenase-like protein [Frankiales bacterium]
MLTPPYDRAGLTTGIVHLGVGGFHRSHEARYVDQLLRRGKARDWAITGVGVLPSDTRMRDALQQNDGLYSLVVKHPDGTTEIEVIGSITGMLLVSEDRQAVVELMSAPSTRIVSLTVTEGGYSGRQDWMGLVADSLALRRERGVTPYTVMSCDNILGNGDVTRAALADYGIDVGGVAFPNGMVDRITPVTSDEDRELTEDPWPVVCEPWTQWVLEDHFTDGRPPFQDVGVQLVEDVEPYELMKLRLLNGSHQAMAYLGHLAGYTYAHEVCQDPEYVAFLQAFMAEVTPTLRPVPGIDLDAYKAALVERFANPAIRDTLARLCADSSNRIPNWLTPAIREQLDAGGDIDALARVVASWCRYAQVVDVDDPRKELVMRAARQGTFLEELFPTLLDERFVRAFENAPLP